MTLVVAVAMVFLFLVEVTLITLLFIQNREELGKQLKSTAKGFRDVAWQAVGFWVLLGLDLLVFLAVVLLALSGHLTANLP